MRDVPAASSTLAVALVIVAVGMLGACSTEAPRGSTSSSDETAARVVPGGGACAFIVDFRGHRYEAVEVAVEPVPGEVIGRAVLPGCDDTDEASPEPAEFLRVASFPGLDPDVALVWADAPDRIFVRRGLEELPPGVAALVHPPACNAADEPIQLRGQWLGILGADGKTELDLIPPYDLTLRVDQASAPGYERAHLEVRVPAGLGTPLTHEDVTSSLWEGGRIQIAATCEGGRFIAEQVRAFPPR